RIEGPALVRAAELDEQGRDVGRRASAGGGGRRRRGGARARRDAARFPLLAFGLHLPPLRPVDRLLAIGFQKWLARGRWTPVRPSSSTGAGRRLTRHGATFGLRPESPPPPGAPVLAVP